MTGTNTGDLPVVFDPHAYPLSRRLRWKYARKSMLVSVSPELAAQLEAAGLGKTPDEAA